MGLPKPKSRGGRPRKQKIKPGDRVSIGFRVTPKMKAKIDAAAEESGRSQAQEIELRLERSFDRQDLAMDFLSARFGPETANMLVILGHGMKAAGLIANIARMEAPPSAARVPISVNWLDDPEIFDVVASTVAKIFNGFRATESAHKDGKATLNVDALSEVAARTTADWNAGDKDDMTQIARVVSAYRREVGQ